MAVGFNVRWKSEGEFTRVEAEHKITGVVYATSIVSDTECRDAVEPALLRRALAALKEEERGSISCQAILAQEKRERDFARRSAASKRGWAARYRQEVEWRKRVAETWRSISDVSEFLPAAV
jgi:hypothetical protein